MESRDLIRYEMAWEKEHSLIEYGWKWIKMKQMEALGVEYKCKRADEISPLHSSGNAVIVSVEMTFFKY